MEIKPLVIIVLVISTVKCLWINRLRKMVPRFLMPL